jgi:hypothetical protein
MFLNCGAISSDCGAHILGITQQTKTQAFILTWARKIKATVSVIIS